MEPKELAELVGITEKVAYDWLMSLEGCVLFGHQQNGNAFVFMQGSGEAVGPLIVRLLKALPEALRMRAVMEACLGDLEEYVLREAVPQGRA